MASRAKSSADLGLLPKSRKARALWIVAVGVSGLTILGFKVRSLMDGNETLDVLSGLGTSYFDFYNSAQRLKWLHYKVLELTTRGVEDFSTYSAQYYQANFDKDNAIEMLTTLSPIVGFGGDVEAALERYKVKDKMQSADNQRAMDSSSCSTWAPIDCTITVPGVASNVDITVRLQHGKDRCDKVDGGRGVCEWVPDRPDVIPEPQPPNLLNKCVCYACKGVLPTPDFVLPVEYQSTSKGTDAKYQCLNDPALQADGCLWDGGNCVPSKAKPSPGILNSTEYMSRFDSMLVDIDLIANVAGHALFDQLTGLIVRFETLFVFGFVLIGGSVIGSTVSSILLRRRLGKWTNSRLWFVHFSHTVLTVFIIASGMWLNDAFSDHLHELKDNKLPLLQNAWDVLYQDAVLTTSANRFVASADGTGWVDEEYTGVPGGIRVYDFWFVRYITNVALLDNAIAKAQEKCTTAEDLNTFRNIDRVNKLLVDLETTALTSTEPPDASALASNDTSMGRAVLLGDSYSRAKLVYNSENQRFLAIQKTKVSEKLNRVLEGGSVQLKLATVADVLSLSLALALLWLKALLMNETLAEKERQAEERRKLPTASKDLCHDVSRSELETTADASSAVETDDMPPPTRAGEVWKVENWSGGQLLVI